jgi:hypothetical protein
VVRHHMFEIEKTAETESVFAECQDRSCRDRWEGANALAIGSLHARSYGHRVTGRRVTAHTYDISDAKKAELRDFSKLLDEAAASEKP